MVRRVAGSGGWAMALVASLATTAHSQAHPPTARLVYDRGAGADACPDDAALRDAVAARLGYDALVDAAPVEVRATVAARGRLLEARIEVRDADGHVAGERRLRSPRRDCVELASAVELAISIAVDPIRGALPAPSAQTSTTVPSPVTPPSVTPPSVTPPPVAPPTPSPRTLAPVRAQRDRVHLRVGVEALGSLGALPTVAFGGGLSAGVAWRALSVDVEFGGLGQPVAFDAPSGGRIAAWSTLAGVRPCGHVAWLALCARGVFGALGASASGLDIVHDGTAPYAAAGVGAGVEVPLAGPVVFTARADALVVLTSVVLQTRAQTAWSTPAVTGDLAAGIGLRF